ncbi:MAG: hypothetical protein ACE5IY_18125 [bacterium]
MLWYVGKGLQIIGLAQVLVGLYIGFSQNDLRTELKIALIGVAIFGIGRLMEIKFTK